MALLYKSALFSKVWNYICSNIASRCRNIALVFIQGSSKRLVQQMAVILPFLLLFWWMRIKPSYIFKSMGGLDPNLNLTPWTYPALIYHHHASTLKWFEAELISSFSKSWWIEIGCCNGYGIVFYQAPADWRTVPAGHYCPLFRNKRTNFQIIDTHGHWKNYSVLDFFSLFSVKELSKQTSWRD